MTLQQLRYILEVSRSRSIREASKRLFITQPALSGMIHDLEAELGITIFERTGKGVTLTSDGRTLMEHAARVVADEESLREAFRHDAEEPALRFSVSSHHFGFVNQAFSDTIRHFDAGKYRTELLLATTSDILENLISKRSDIGFLSIKHAAMKKVSQMLASHDLAFQALYTGRPYVYLSRWHPLAGAALLTAEDLMPYPRIYFDQRENPLFLFSEEPVLAPETSARLISANDLYEHVFFYDTLDAFAIGSGFLTPEATGCVTVPFDSDEQFDIGYVLAGSSQSEVCTYMLSRVKALLDAFGEA